jgi:hypothetical protein
MSSKTSSVDLMIESIAEAQDISVEKAAEQYLKASEHAMDLENLPIQNHLWTDRGEKFTCENAGHPYHEAWRRRKAVI